MVMDTLQIRLSPGLIEKIDSLVGSGIYSSRADVIRDAVRRLILDKVIGIIPDSKSSVKEIKTIRDKLSKNKFDLKSINKLAD